MSRRALGPRRSVAVCVVTGEKGKEMALLTLTEKPTGKYWEPFKKEVQYLSGQSEKEMIERAAKGALKKMFSAIIKKDLDPGKLILNKLEDYECFDRWGNPVSMDLEEAKKTEIAGEGKEGLFGIREHFVLTGIPCEILEKAIEPIIEMELFDRRGIESLSSSWSGKRMHHFDENLVMKLLKSP